jgi:hypothetical protein
MVLAHVFFILESINKANSKIMQWMGSQLSTIPVVTIIQVSTKTSKSMDRVPINTERDHNKEKNIEVNG